MTTLEHKMIRASKQGFKFDITAVVWVFTLVATTVLGYYTALRMDAVADAHDDRADAETVAQLKQRIADLEAQLKHTRPVASTR